VATLIPRQIQAARAITLRGVSYSANQVLSAAQIASMPRLSALLSSGRLKAVPDTHGRKAVRGGRTPTSVAPRNLKVLTSVPDFSVSADLDAQNTMRVIVTMTGGDGPFSVDWGDTAVSSVKGRTSSHTYAGAGLQTVTVTAENGDTATDTVTTS
jgi:hypothetical protein